MDVTAQFPFAITITRYRRTKTYDPMSDAETLGAWSTATAADVPHCLFAPGTSDTFPNVDVEAITHHGSLYMPLGADVSEFDRVIVDNATWDVIGRRSNWRGGDTTGSTVPLRFVREGNAYAGGSNEGR